MYYESRNNIHHPFNFDNQNKYRVGLHVMKLHNRMDQDGEKRRDGLKTESPEENSEVALYGS